MPCSGLRLHCAYQGLEPSAVPVLGTRTTTAPWRARTGPRTQVLGILPVRYRGSARHPAGTTPRDNKPGCVLRSGDTSDHFAMIPGDAMTHTFTMILRRCNTHSSGHN